MPYLSLGLICAVLLSSYSWSAKERKTDPPPPCISNILAEAKTPFEQAIGLSVEKKFDEVVYLLKSGELSEHQIFFVWKWWADNDGYAAIKMLSLLDIDARHQDEIINSLAKIPSPILVKYFSKIKGAQTRNLLLNKLAKTQSIASILKSLPVDSFLVEMIVAQIESGKLEEEELETLLTKCSEHSSEFRFLIYLAIAKYADLDTWKIKLSEFTDEQKTQIATAIAKRGVNDAPSYIKRIPSRDDRAIAFGYYLAADFDKTGWGYAESSEKMLDSVDLDSETYGYTIARVVVANVSDQRISERRDRDEALLELFPLTVIPHESNHRPILRTLFMRDFIGSLATRYGVNHPDLLPFDAQGDGPDLRSILSDLSRHYPDVITPDFLQMIVDGKVRNSQVVAHILNSYFSQTVNDPLETFPKDPLQLLCRVSGLDFCSLSPSKLAQSPGKLFALVSSIQSQLISTPAFARVHFDASAFENKDAFLELLELLNNLSLKNEDWFATLSEVGLLDATVSGDDLPEYIQRAKDVFVARFKKTLAQSKTEITYENLLRLNEEWGDLEPIMTLFQRFSSKKEWEKEVAVLGQVLKESLEGSFNRYKFDSKTEQLSFLKSAELKAWMKPRAVARLSGSEKPSVVLSVVNSDPKFLLTIGDLVQVTSCQNYRTGSHAQTLLGYVIDGNVQAMASFVLKQQDFNSSQDYNELVARRKEGGDMKVSFNGNRKVAVFEFGENATPKTIYTKPLSNAYLRQMLKLGQTQSGRPGIRLENEYQQAHSATATMRANHQALLNEIALEIRANQDEPILIPKSRNPLGVYSDLSKGIHLSGYKIN